MSLVDYGSSDSENEPQSLDADQTNKKRKQEDKAEQEDPNERPQKFAQLDTESKLPPLPDMFADAEPQNDNNTKKSSPQPPSVKSKGSTLLPPQLWKKKGNVSTEDTAAWNSDKAKKTPPKQTTK